MYLGSSKCKICVLVHFRIKGEAGTVNMFKPFNNFLTDRSKAVLILLTLIVIYVLCLSLSFRLVCSLQPCGHFWERADFLVLLCVMSSCVFVTFQYDVLGRCGT